MTEKSGPHIPRRRRLNVVITTCHNWKDDVSCPFYRDWDDYPSTCVHPGAIEKGTTQTAKFNNDECPLPEVPPPSVCPDCKCKLDPLSGAGMHKALCPRFPL